jgi:hypothetical protein
MFKKIIIFFYISLIINGFIHLFLPIKTITVHPLRTNVNQKIQSYINYPLIYFNQGLIEKNIYNLNRFYYNIKINYKENSVEVHYDYEKPVLIWNNTVITLHGKKYNYESSLLLPTVNENLKDVLTIAKTINTKFSVKLIESIKYENYTWVIYMGNGQKWIGQYSWNKTIKDLNKIPKKAINTIIRENRHQIIFILNNRLLMKKR